jgi:hypothetical protein
LERAGVQVTLGLRRTPRTGVPPGDVGDMEIERFLDDLMATHARPPSHALLAGESV